MERARYARVDCFNAPWMSFTSVGAIACALLFSAQVRAHEYWFEPETFFPAAGERTAVHLHVGDGLIKDRQERPFQAVHTPLFRGITPSGNLDLRPAQAEGALPVHVLATGQAGGYLLAMERDWFFISLDARKFEAYLRDEGLEHVIAERAARGETDMAGRERYSRFIKSLLQVGEHRDHTYEKQAGMRLEITPLENPYAKKIGEDLLFQVMFDGKPLAGQAVYADNRGSATQARVTDRDGRVTMHIERAGLWLLRLVHMRRCTADCGAADWESFWGAFTFGAR